MREALKHLSKSKSDDREMRIASANQRIRVAEDFVKARQLILTQPQQALAQCQNLLMALPPEGQVGAVGS